MQQMSKHMRSKATMLAAALTLTCGLAALPQYALAEEGLEQQTINQTNDEGTDQEQLAAVNPDDNATVTPQPAAPAEEPAAPAEPQPAEAEPPAEPTSEDTANTGDNTGNAGDNADANAGGAAASDQNADAENTTTDPQPQDKPAEEPAKAVEPAKAEQPRQTAPAKQTATATQQKATTVKAQGNGATVKNGTYIIESGIATKDNTGLVKLVLSPKDSVKNGAPVITWSYSGDGTKGGNSTQHWLVESVGDGWYTIKAATNQNLALTATNGGNTNNGLYLTTYVPDLASQLWQFIFYGKNYGQGYQIQAKAKQKAWNDQTIAWDYDKEMAKGNAPKAIDIDHSSPDRGTHVGTWTASSAVKSNQEFYLVNVRESGQIGAKAGVKGMGGKYRILASGTNKAVEPNGGKKNDGTNIALWTNNNKAHQDIYLQDLNNGYYIIWDMGTAKVLDVAYSSPLAGANIIQWSYNGKNNQQWAIRKNSDGTVTFINKATGMVLGAATSAAKANGNYNIASIQDVDRNANKFTLKGYALISNNIICKIQKIGTKNVLDVSRSSTANNAAISFWKDNGQNNQRFQIISIGGGKYRIRTASSGGWIIDNNGKFVQYGKHATAANNSNSWVLEYFKGNLRFVNVGSRRVMLNASVKIIGAPLTIPLGNYEIHSNAKVNNFKYDALLDNPGGSKKSGTHVGVYPDKNGANQKWTITKSGNSYKITNSLTGLALCTAGTKIALYRSSNSKDQLWSIGIADGGNIKFINNKNGQVLDIAGSGNLKNGNTLTYLAKDSADREAHQSFKLEKCGGWSTANGKRYFTRTDGKVVQVTNAGYSAWQKVQGYSSSSKYLVVIDNKNCRTYLFTGAKGAWEILADWICTVGTSPAKGGDDTFGETFRGVSKIRKKGTIMGNCPYELYWTEFYINSAALNGDGEGQRFHSILFWDKGGKDVYDGTLGQQASHGCVRLSLANSKWMYKNVPLGTTVWSY